MGNFVYTRDGLRYHFADGYTDGTTNGYHYYIRDHQGNNRVVAKYDGTIEQTTHYYPYGGILSQSTNQGFQKFKYNGKEFDTMHGLNMYDYGARQQDPAVGMFTSMDPLCEVDYYISPYAFCGGNPVNRVDKDGRIWDTIWDAGNLLWDVGSAIYNHATGNHKAAKANWTDAGLDLVATLIPCVPAGATKLVKAADSAVDVAKAADKAADAQKGMKNAAKIKEGLAFEKESLIASKRAGNDVTPQVRLVPQNGKGNVKLNRTNADQLIKNSDGTYSIVETKLSSKTSLSKGQKTAKEHVKKGNGMLEVRSNKGSLRKGDKIQIKEYQRENKYN